MRLPIGSTDVTPSGGTVTLIGRRGEGWAPAADRPMDLDEAIEILGFPDVPFPGERLVPVGEGTRFRPGEDITIHLRRAVDTARVVHDDERGLVTWTPTGSQRLSIVPVGVEHVRDLPLQERFAAPWRMTEGVWRGAGVLKVMPHGTPWSVWFFRDDAGKHTGIYLNLEAPHRRPTVDDPIPNRTHSDDWTLDVWMDGESVGNEDVWLKDEDELDLATDLGRFTPAQRDAVRAVADHACAQVFEQELWPMRDSWETWQPDEEMDRPVLLPEHEIIRWWRGRTGVGLQED